jgi:hypothetical protein
MIWRLATILIVLLIGGAVLDLGWRAITRSGDSAPVAAVSPAAPPAPAPGPASAAPSAPPPSPAPACSPAPAFAEAAAQNAASLGAAQWSAMGRPETGWETYAPLAAHELVTACAPADPGFAQALASWQGQHGRPATGIMDEATLKALDVVWLRRRPFVGATAHGACPPPPPAFRLAFATPAEGYEHKPIQLRTTALAAYRRLAAAAHEELPSAFADPRMLTIFSGYRDPAEEAARCAGGGCGTVAKASCSAHRTGLAMDLYLGTAPGYPPESSADANRLYQSRTGIYRWLVANAARFGFTPYPFEPWHWEWTEEPL